MSDCCHPLSTDRRLSRLYATECFQNHSDEMPFFSSPKRTYVFKEMSRMPCPKSAITNVFLASGPPHVPSGASRRPEFLQRHTKKVLK